MSHTEVMSGALLQGRGVIVTGGASPRGLGLAAARLLAEHGAQVLIADLDEDAAAAAAKTLPGVREAMEDGEWDIARQQAGMLVEALDRATSVITRASDQARAIAPRLVS